MNEQFFLIDCGEGTQMQLRKYHARLGKINHIFISHVHGDHVFGLFGLISSFSLLGRELPLHIYGPGELEELLLDHLKYFQNELGFELMIHKTSCRRSALVYHDQQITVHTVPLRHRVRTCGYKFCEKQKERNMIKEMIGRYRIPLAKVQDIKRGADFVTDEGEVVPNKELTLPPYRSRSYAYCSDTLYSEEMVRYLKDVDVLFHEATFAEEDRKLAETTSHSTARQAAEIARKAGAGRLLIGHFSSRYKDVSLLEEEAREIFPETSAVSDGDLISIEQRRMEENM